MKRRIFSVLFALVLACSLGLVTAVPAGAQSSYPGLWFQVLDKSEPAVGTASWVEDTHSGNYAVRLETGTPDALEQVDFACVVFPYNQALSTITELGYSYKLIEGRPANDSAPYVVLGLDTDETPGADTWVVHHMFVTAAEDTWGTWLLSTDPVDPAWHAFPGDVDYADWAAVKAAFDEDMVLNIKIAVGEWDSDHLESHHVDGFRLNTVTYDLEQPAAVWVATDGDDANPGTEAEPFLTIQYAIDILAGDCTVNVAAGTYTKDLTIDKSLTLQGEGSENTTIKGVLTEPDASFPLAVPNIDILSPGVKIHDFTIEGPTAVANKYASGMLIGASNVEIYENDFKVTAGRDTIPANESVSVAIQTYRKVAVEGVDISGLNIHDNTFTNLGDGLAGYDGIYINIDEGTGLATIEENEFTGNLFRPITVERSNVVISGNSIVTDLAPYTASAGGYQGMFIGCFPVDSEPGPVQSNVVITFNTVKGSGEGDGFVQGIRVGHSTQLGLSGIIVSQNTVEGNNEGIAVKAPADATPVDVVVNYNSIVGNTLGAKIYGGTAVVLDAECNWWGDVAGPDTTGNTMHNPYEEWAHTKGVNGVSNYVDYLPWLIRTDLVVDFDGWNIVSWPIMGEEVEPPPPPEEIKAIYWFDSSIQRWGYDPYEAGALDAMYVKVSDNITFSYCISSDATFPSQKAMKVGWNFVGLAELHERPVNVALSDAKWGTGVATDLVGYNKVRSPSLNGVSWTFMRGQVVDIPDMIPTKGYWVLMVNDGVLGGFTETPIVEEAP